MRPPCGVCQASEPRRCLVLVTGDGNAHKGQHNFPQLLTHALQHGWNVEIVCWRDCVNPVYETLRNDYPTQVSKLIRVRAQVPVRQVLWSR